MSECNDKIYQFATGEALGFVEFEKNGNIWQSFKLLITSGDIVGTVDPDYMFYSVLTDNRGRVIDKFLNYGSLEYRINHINYLSAELNKDGQFVITGSGHNDSILSAIEKDNMTLTGYGEEIFRECFGSTMEYYAPADDSTDHSCGQANCEADNGPYLAMNLDIL